MRISERFDLPVVINQRRPARANLVIPSLTKRLRMRSDDEGSYASYLRCTITSVF